MKTQAAAHMPRPPSLGRVLHEGLRSHAALHRIRYALRARIGAPDIFHSDPPPAVDADVPVLFAETARRFGLAGAPPSFETAFELARQLASRTQHGRHLGTTSVNALRRMCTGPAGVCSDYAQVYMGLCAAVGIACREWGVCERLTGTGMGHTMSEIWCETRRKWIVIDAYCSVFVEDEGTPLAMTEIMDRVHGGLEARLHARPIDSTGCEPAFREHYVDRYFARNNIVFLLSHYDPFRQDRVIERVAKLPLPLCHAAMILAGVYQRFELYVGGNEGSVRRHLMDIRFHVARAALCAGGLAVLLAMGLGVWG